MDGVLYSYSVLQGMGQPWEALAARFCGASHPREVGIWAISWPPGSLSCCRYGGLLLHCSVRASLTWLLGSPVEMTRTRSLAFSRFHAPVPPLPHLSHQSTSSPPMYSSGSDGQYLLIIARRWPKCEHRLPPSPRQRLNWPCFRQGPLSRLVCAIMFVGSFTYGGVGHTGSLRRTVHPRGHVLAVTSFAPLAIHTQVCIPTPRVQEPESPELPALTAI